MGYTFVLGGARSGKSTYAETLTGRLAEIHGLPVTYVATAQASDDEMAQRVGRHRDRRPADWSTAEIPLDVAGWLRANSQPNPNSRQVILIDCLSLLLNNWMFLEGCDEVGVFERIDKLVQAMAESPNPIVVVSNEVGQGIVPADELSRNYRDWLGLMNQRVAEVAEKVIWVIAGIPVDIRLIQTPLP